MAAPQILCELIVPSGRGEIDIRMLIVISILWKKEKEMHKCAKKFRYDFAYDSKEDNGDFMKVNIIYCKCISTGNEDTCPNCFFDVEVER